MLGESDDRATTDVASSDFEFVFGAAQSLWATSVHCGYLPTHGDRCGTDRINPRSAPLQRGHSRPGISEPVEA